MITQETSVRKRDGRVVTFDAARISRAVANAFRAERGLSKGAELRPELREEVERTTVSVMARLPETEEAVDVEQVQDLVEEQLMRDGNYRVARRYIVYREEHKKARMFRGEPADGDRPAIKVRHEDGSESVFEAWRIRRRIEAACRDLEHVDPGLVLDDALGSLYDGITPQQIQRATILAARSHIENDPAYGDAAARLLLGVIYREAWTEAPAEEDFEATHRQNFADYLRTGIEAERLSSELLEFDLDELADALRPERDEDFTYLGLQTIYDRYLIEAGDRRIECPQYFWMRVAMGLALNEDDREARAIEFYEMLSAFRVVSATPTLFNSGTQHPQLSSCYLTTVGDDLESIFKAVSDNAKLSKWAGGLGNDWTNIRATGSLIKGTGGESQGVIPFLKIVNDTAVAVNQGGKRKGAACSYMETWHLDIEDFLELRKNTGDERRRTHDMNTANWVPDLFVKRVMEGGEWTLFSPNEVSDLHDLYGRAFEERYVEYERMADRGELRQYKRVEANALWRKMLSMLFETGHPWITFKDPSNLRSPQDHAGVVHSSNLCCMTADQRVVTAEGILTVEELFDRATPSTVVGRSGSVSAGPMLLPRPDAPIVRIVTREGYTHKVTPDHKVWVVDRGWVEAQDLEKGDLLEIQQVEGLWGQIDLPDEALLCGLVAGDGTFGRNEKTAQVHLDLWANDFVMIPEIEKRVARVLAQPAYAVDYATTATAQPQFRGDEFRRRLTSTPLARVLLNLGFRRETKLQVPDFVWRGNRETVSQYLRGLYLTDATVQAQELGVTTCSLASHSKKFLQEIQILLANFGVKSTLRKMRDAGPAMLPDGEGGEREFLQSELWRLLVTSIKGCQILEKVTGIGHVRNNARYLDNLEKPGYRQKLWATFEGLEILPNEDAYCLQVFTDEHSWTVNGLITKNTEILLNTSAEETAVCNLCSLNLGAHTDAYGLDEEKLSETIKTAVRMLDNVVDINFYPTPEAETANARHRPVGLGLMGFQDALFEQRIGYASEEAVRFADYSMELISYHAILASSELAAERGTYTSYEGSKWSRGLLPIDTIDLLEQERGVEVEMDRSTTLDWQVVRDAVAENGMRNSNVMAIAPTATISNISGVYQSIEPTYSNLFVKSNLSGEFTVINPYLVRDLKKRGLWDEEMIEDLKHFDGSVQEIERVPEDLKQVYLTAFEIDPGWIIDCASRRQKWIDMGQSLNLYLAQPSGKLLSEMYLNAWSKGLKTTYYLRSRGATNVEKSNMDVNKRGIQPRWMKSQSASSRLQEEQQMPVVVQEAVQGETCSPDDPECEACQ